MKRRLRILMLLAALAASTSLAGLAWLLGTESGLHWAMERAGAATGGKLTFEGASGTLGAGVTLVRVAYADAGLRVEATRVAARARVLPLLRGHIGIEPLTVESLRVALEDGTRTAAPAPAALPVGLRLGEVRIARFELHVAGQTHRLQSVHFSHAAIGPRTLQLGGSFVRPDARFPITVELTLRGTLRRFEAAVSGTVAGIPAQAKLALEPQHRQPLRALEARAGPADPAKLRADLPHGTVSALLLARATDGGYAGELSLTNSAPAALDAGGVPLTSARTHFASRGLERARLTQLRLKLGEETTLEGQGEVDAERLRALLTVRGLDMRALRSSLRRTRLDGKLDLDLGRENQAVRGALAEKDILVEADVLRDGELVEVRELHARAAGGEARGSGRIRLAKRIGVQANLRVERFDPAAFGDFPQGAISGRLEVDGLLGDAPQAQARWTIEPSTLAGRPLESRGRARFAPDRVTQVQAEARYGPARLGARGAFGKAGDALDVTLDVQRLEDVDADLRGALRAQGTLSGTWAEPVLRAQARVPALRLPGDDKSRAAHVTVEGTQAQHTALLRLEAPGSHFRARLAGGWHGERGWQGEVAELENEGTYPLRLLAAAPLELARERVSLGKLEAQVANGRLLVHEARWSPGRLTTRGEARGLPAAWIALLFGEAEHVRSTMLLDGQWQLDAAAAPLGTVHLRRASGDLDLRAGGEAVALEISSAELDARFADNGLTITARARSRFGELALEGGIGLAPDRPAAGYGTRSPLALRARIESASLRSIAQPFITQARIDGRLAAQLGIDGTLGEPRIQGELRATAVRFEIPAYGVQLTDGQLDARLEGGRIRIASLSIRGGDGEFAASGSLSLDPAAGGARLGWTAREFGVLSRRDRRLTVSGAGEVAFDGKRVLLTGELRADRGYLLIADDSLPRPGEDVVIVGQAPKPEPGGPTVPLALDVQLDLGADLAIESQTMVGKLAGRLRVANAEDGRLRVYGRLRAVNAIFYAYGQRLLVDPGELIFDGPLDDPALAITAWRRNQAVEAGVQISGNLKAPRVQLVSNPPVGESERLSWLVLGRAPGEASRADLGLLQAAAGALLTRGSALPADRRIARAFGFDELTLRGGGELESSVVAVGKRVSDRAYVSYEQGLGAVTTSLVKLDYALGPRWSVRGEAGTSSGAGLFYRFAWD
ncbi:MAG: translocation/assembly module TamB domain-containing protein [Betaproteobacteria bacterium]|nr:translocation/assembly module TamB domain-containing protein [Betaproteobacteria bacterium]MDH5220936.1 translocation/assembly module TamB domain-containing protein [Betaproteobacteria bacterium]MDH5351949.1 translocation/assembly module TamB domain-containing protein [Betaproteobacteria bacterium]